MTSKKQLRAELAAAEDKKERLQRSLVQLQTALSQARNQASTIEHQSQMSNQQLVAAAATPKQRALYLQGQIKQMKEMIDECELELQQLRKNLRGE
jgi:predicted  nucleic acid-binding Zn-ribbon protein